MSRPTLFLNSAALLLHAKQFSRVRAEGEVAEFIDDMERVIRERATGDPGTVAREIPLRLIRFDRAVRDIQDRGLTINDGKKNPMLPKSRRIVGGIFDDLNEIGAI